MDTPYVDEISAQRAAEYESRFQLLRPDGGILFVGIEAVPAVGGFSTTFIVRLGVAKWMDPRTGMAIIQTVLKDELLKFDIQGAAYRGVRGAGHDDPAGTHPDPS
jgi:hypothetical protein